MKVVDDGIFDRLSSSAELLALLSTYAGAPAIITTTPVPPGVVPPFIVVPSTPMDQTGGWETKNSAGRQWRRDIFLYMRNKGDSSVADDGAELIRDLFHRKHGLLTIAGFDVMVCEATGPIEAPTDDTMFGRVVTVMITAAVQL